MCDVPDQSGRRFVVTGATSGTGKEAAARLAGAGARVTLAVRSADRGEATRREILRAHPGADVDVSLLDLADLDAVRAFARSELADARPLHVLVNNAGVSTPPDRLRTPQGHELQWGTNFLGPFALTCLLLPKLLRAEAPRVATMASAAAAMGRIRVEDLDWDRGYRPLAAYAQSTLADLLMGLELARVAAARGWPTLGRSLWAIAEDLTGTHLPTAG